MSVTVSFVSATPEELDRAEKEPDWADGYVFELYDADEPDVPGRPDCGPEKAWAGLQYLFEESDTDLYLDFLMDGFPLQEDGTLSGWTPEHVADLARDLQNTPWERLAAHYAPERMAREEVYPNMWRFRPEEELEWLKEAYEELVAFFTVVAGRGHGAFMMFTF